MSLLFMIVSSLAFAGLDLIRKLLAGRVDALALVLFMSLGAFPLLAAVLLVRGFEAPSAEYFLPAAGTLALNFLGSLGFIHSVRLSPLSRTIPLLSLTPVFAALTAIPLLGELPTAAQTAGILLVVAGAIALNAGDSPSAVLRGFWKEKGALLMVAVALLWAAAGPLDKLALAHASPFFHATTMALGVGLAALALIVSKRELGVLGAARSDFRLLLAMTACTTVALTFQFLAIRLVLVSLVEAFKRAVGSLMAVMLGKFLFGERVRPKEWTAVTVMVAGVFLILV